MRSKESWKASVEVMREYEDKELRETEARELEEGEVVPEGWLHCAYPGCARMYPEPKSGKAAMGMRQAY